MKIGSFPEQGMPSSQLPSTQCSTLRGQDISQEVSQPLILPKHSISLLFRPSIMDPSHLISGPLCSSHLPLLSSLLPRSPLMGGSAEHGTGRVNVLTDSIFYLQSI